MGLMDIQPIWRVREGVRRSWRGRERGWREKGGGWQARATSSGGSIPLVKFEGDEQETSAFSLRREHFLCFFTYGRRQHDICLFHDLTLYERLQFSLRLLSHSDGYCWSLVGYVLTREFQGRTSRMSTNEERYRHGTGTGSPGSNPLGTPANQVLSCILAPIIKEITTQLAITPCRVSSGGLLAILTCWHLTLCNIALKPVDASPSQERSQPPISLPHHLPLNAPE